MRFRRVPTFVAGSSVLAGLIVAAGPAVGPAAGPAAAQPVTGDSGAVPIAPSDSSTRTITLITGDRVTLTPMPDGSPGISVAPRPGGSAAFVTERGGGDLYVIPADAQPFLGRQLDVSLFDVSAPDSDGRIPVVLSGSDAAPPGVVLTDRTHGYVTPESAAQFGAALHRDAAGVSGVSSAPILGGVTWLARADAVAPPVVQPQFVMKTLRINTVGLTGDPVDIGTVVVLNTDDGRKYATLRPLATVGGEVRISVPVGHYAVSALFNAVENGTFVERLAQLADVTVRQDTAVTLDARAADAPVSVDVPRPSQLAALGVQYVRQDEPRTFRAGVGVLINPAVAAIDVQPAKSARSGELTYSVQAHRDSPPGAASPYAYDIELVRQAVPADEHFRVRSGDLATIKANYYSDVPSWQVVPTRIAALSSDLVHIGFGTPTPVPGTRVEYVSADPAITYFDSVTPQGTSTPMTDGGRKYRAGTVSTVDWMRGPRAPGFGAATPDTAGGWTCPACREGDHIALQLSGLIDSVPGHAMGPDYGPGREWDAQLSIAENGKVLLDWPGIFGITLPASGPSGDYALTYDQTTRAPWSTHSQRSHSEWTFHSQRPTANTVPATWVCPDDDPGPCAAVPLLVADYALPQALDGTVAPGRSAMAVTFRHASGAPSVPIRSAAVEVSFDDGQTWTRTALAGAGGGRYVARWTSPAGAHLSVRVTARDAAGATLTQSVLDAATVSASN
jgi:hypothetical protein